MGNAGDRIGFSLSTSDVDGDCVSEVFFGTPFNNGPIGAEKGTAYVFALIDGDYDGDGDRDLRDFEWFQQCFTSFEGELSPPCYVFDFEADGVLDLADFAEFAGLLEGPRRSVAGNAE
jgi:hypothetical protein